jgi:hypothetical protein
MSARDNWRLESFIDALIFELDKAQDTLSVKGVNRRLTYTVKDVAVDLNVFPDYDQDELRFAVAKPGENGASRITFQLGSITDRQIRETTRDPISSQDIAIDDVDELPTEVKTRLKRIGIKSAEDLERVEKRDIALPSIVSKDPAQDGTAQDGPGAINYKNLADIISKARRRRAVPRIQSLSVVGAAPGHITLQLGGENLDDPEAHPGYPLAVVRDLDIAARRIGNAIEIDVPRSALQPGENPVSLAIDRTAVLTFHLVSRGQVNG